MKKFDLDLKNFDFDSLETHCMSLKKVAKAFGVTESQVRKWRAHCPPLESKSKPYDLPAIALFLIGTKVMSPDDVPPSILIALTCSFASNAAEVGKLDRVVSRLDLSQTSDTSTEAIKRAVGRAAQAARCPPLRADESAAIAIASPKSAALFVDRVWTIDPSVPSDVEFTCGTRDENIVRGLVSTLIASMVEAKFGKARIEVWDASGESDEEIEKFVDEAEGQLERQEQMIAPMLEKMACTAIYEATKREISPFMATTESFQALHREGGFQVVSVVLENMKIVDEPCLTWEHVSAIREDKAAMKKLRRMTHWLDGAMAGKSLSYIEEEIGKRVDEYEEGLKLTGAKVREGRIAVLTELTNWSALAGLTTGAAANALLFGSSTPTATAVSIIAALSGLTLLGGKLHCECRSIRRTHEEILEKNEIAYLYEIQRER